VRATGPRTVGRSPYEQQRQNGRRRKGTQLKDARVFRHSRASQGEITPRGVWRRRELRADRAAAQSAISRTSSRSTGRRAPRDVGRSQSVHAGLKGYRRVRSCGPLGQGRLEGPQVADPTGRGRLLVGTGPSCHLGMNAQADRIRPSPFSTLASGKRALTHNARRPFRWIRVMPGTEGCGNSSKAHGVRTVSLAAADSLTPGVISLRRRRSRCNGQLSPFPASRPRTGNVSAREHRSGLTTESAGLLERVQP
jgi:hypothetical protein